MFSMIPRLIFTLISSLFILLPAHAVSDLPQDIPEELIEEANSSFIFVFHETVEAG